MKSLKFVFSICVCRLFSIISFVCCISLQQYTRTRCHGHLRYVRSLFDRSCFYKMKAVLIFKRWVGSATPYPPAWGCAPDPAFLQWHREFDRLTSQCTKLNTNQQIILVKICILETLFRQFFVSPNKYITSKKFFFFAQSKR